MGKALHFVTKNIRHEKKPTLLDQFKAEQYEVNVKILKNIETTQKLQKTFNESFTESHSETIEVLNSLSKLMSANAEQIKILGEKIEKLEEENKFLKENIFVK